MAISSRPQLSSATTSSSQVPNRPQLDADDVELLALLAQRLVPKRRARATHALLERVVQPEAEVPIAAPDAEEARLGEDHVVVDARVREGLEADALRWGRGAGAGDAQLLGGA